MEMVNKWEKAQQAEMRQQLWYYTDHIPLKRRYQMEGYRLCEGRHMLLHCGIPQSGLTVQEITGKLLDVGCGTVSVWEHRPNIEVTAIDPLMRAMAAHPKLKKFAVVGPKNNALYLSQPLEEIGLGGEFDWVWNYNVLDHTGNWREHLAHCKRVLRPGGVLLLGVDVRTPEYDFGQHDDEPEMHPSVFTADELLEELGELGMRVTWRRPLLKVPKFRMGLRAQKE